FLHLVVQMKLFLVGTLSVILGVVIWYFATEYKFNFFISFENVPSPLKVGGAFITQLNDSEFYIHILVSMRRILFAYSIAVVLGIGVGLIVGRSKFARAAVLPYIEIVRPIPAVAWIPLAILMWPTEESSIVYITFLGALFPIILNTVHGVEQTPEVLIRAALSLGAKRFQVFVHVVFPAALPSIAAGLAIGMGVSWFSLLAGEIISGQYGIGYFTWNAYSLINYPDIIVGMLVIGGLGSLSTFLVRLIMTPALRWKKRVSH
ncbi:MAG: NitT/TauT family transport system permease protein, partial [Lentisphaeria bacterium]